MDYFNDANVIYLEGIDFNNNNLSSLNGKVITLVQSTGCGWCKKAKPEYSDAANKSKDAIWTTIEMDSADAKLKEVVSKMPNFKGYPHYVLYQNGKLINTYEGGDRSPNALIEFIKSS